MSATHPGGAGQGATAPGFEPLRVGLVGLGGMGRSHLEKNQGSTAARIVAAADVVPAAVEAARERFGVRGFGSHRELIDSGACEAVLIATPHPFHPPVAVDAARAGLHVLSEKPLAVAVSDADRMVAAAREAGVLLGVMFQTRLEPAYQRARELLDDGAIGRLYRSTLVASAWYRTQAYYDSGAWRGTWAGEGGGVLMNQAPHSLDMLIWLGGMPRRVRARVATRAHRIEVEDTVEALLEYEDGHTGYIYATTAEWPGENRYELVGDRGKLVVRDGKLERYRMDRSLAEELARPGMWDKPTGAWQEVAAAADEADRGHAAVLARFAAAVRRGTPPVAGAADGLCQLELANALLLSGYEDRPVDLPVDRAAYDAFLARMRGG